MEKISFPYCMQAFPGKKKFRFRNKLFSLDATVIDLCASLFDWAKYRWTVSEGAKGPITYEFMKKRVVLAKDGQPDRKVWLIVRRTLGEGATYSYFISNAGRSAHLKNFVWLSGVRWAIEQCFEEAKSDLGMDHYEVRKFPGWRHHKLTCMLAHFFLWHMRIRLGEKAPAITLSQLRLLISVVLPIKKFDALDLIDLVSWIQMKNHRAYLSHRKRKLAALEVTQHVSL